MKLFILTTKRETRRHSENHKQYLDAGGKMVLGKFRESSLRFQKAWRIKERKRRLNILRERKGI